MKPLEGGDEDYGDGDGAGDADEDAGPGKGALYRSGKVNKSAVLSSAVEYIHFLEAQIKEKDGEISALASRERAIRLALEHNGKKG